MRILLLSDIHANLEASLGGNRVLLDGRDVTQRAREIGHHRKRNARISGERLLQTQVGSGVLYISLGVLLQAL